LRRSPALDRAASGHKTKLVRSRLVVVVVVVVVVEEEVSNKSECEWVGE